MKALFVCTGNLCRSVMAEYLFKHEAKRRNLQGWQARSCGTAAQPYLDVPSDTLKVLATRGIQGIKHKAELVNIEPFEWADVVFAMGTNHMRVLESLFPEQKRKLRLFMEEAGFGQKTVPDPIGQPAETYEKCCAIIEKGIQEIIDKNAKLAEKPGP